MSFNGRLGHTFAWEHRAKHGQRQLFAVSLVNILNVFVRSKAPVILLRYILVDISSDKICMSLDSMQFDSLLNTTVSTEFHYPNV